jgi:hypothetical protein
MLRSGFGKDELEQFGELVERMRSTVAAEGAPHAVPG